MGFGEGEMMRRALAFSFGCMLAGTLLGQDLPPATQAKFLKMLITSTGQFGFACTDPGLKPQLEASGVSVSPGFLMAWAASEAEAKALKTAGKMVIVPKRAWLKAGGSIALVDEDGKPTIYLNMANVKASGLHLSDAIIQMAKKPN